MKVQCSRADHLLPRIDFAGTHHKPDWRPSVTLKLADVQGTIRVSRRKFFEQRFMTGLSVRHLVRTALIQEGSPRFACLFLEGVSNIALKKNRIKYSTLTCTREDLS